MDIVTWGSCACIHVNCWWMYSLNTIENLIWWWILVRNTLVRVNNKWIINGLNHNVHFMHSYVDSVGGKMDYVIHKISYMIFQCEDWLNYPYKLVWWYHMHVVMFRVAWHVYVTLVYNRSMYLPNWLKYVFSPHLYKKEEVCIWLIVTWYMKS
jgi:hypothetical protein